MSIADESTVPHRPPRGGDTVEVRLMGRIVREHGEYVDVEIDELGGQTMTFLASEVAIVRDIPRYRPGNADRPIGRTE